MNIHLNDEGQKCKMGPVRGRIISGRGIGSREGKEG
jgi:hypothetical protein